MDFDAVGGMTFDGSTATFGGSGTGDAYMAQGFRFTGSAPTAGYIMQTDALGNASWVNPSTLNTSSTIQEAFDQSVAEADVPKLAMTTNNFDITSTSGNFDFSSSSGGQFDVDADGSIYMETATSFTAQATSGGILLDSDDSGSKIHLDSEGTGADGVDIDSAGGVDVDAVGNITMDSSGGEITMTSGSGNPVNLTAPGAGEVILNGGFGLDMNATGAGGFVLTASGASAAGNAIEVTNNGTLTIETQGTGDIDLRTNNDDADLRVAGRDGDCCSLP